MEASWMAGNALLALATWHPDARAITHAPEGRVPLGALGWFCLLACLFTAPLVVVFQLVLDHVYSLTSF
jgi:hypothetical protein